RWRSLLRLVVGLVERRIAVALLLHVPLELLDDQLEHLHTSREQVVLLLVDIGEQAQASSYELALMRRPTNLRPRTVVLRVAHQSVIGNADWIEPNEGAPRTDLPVHHVLRRDSPEAIQRPTRHFAEVGPQRVRYQQIGR